MQQKQGQIEIINFSQYMIKYHEMGMSFVQWRLTRNDVDSPFHI